MKQIIQNLRSGETILEEVPAPMVRRGHVLIKTHKSLVSLGTEKMLVEFSKSSLISKARQQPDKVKQVLDKIKTDGLMPTLEAVFNKLDEPLPLGYCNAGEVIAIGEDVSEFKIGDRVVSNGNHAEFVCVPKNLCALIPENVSYEEAAFTVIGSIGLQGIRLANPSLGETIVVIGLGLIGLITAELLMANGCQVIGFDFDEQKVNLAKEKGILAFNASQGINTVQTVLDINPNGADAVIITASTKSNEVISNAANMSRKRGRIILVGVIGLELNRAEFYKKELQFQVSCSYGPGRYDEAYEQKGNDYPLAFVRWTEKRNFETILHAISNKRLDVKRLITEEINLDDYKKIYDKMGGASIASILSYPVDNNSYKQQVHLTSNFHAKSKGVLGIIGAGNFTKMTMLPALKGSNAIYKYIASAGGLSAKSLASKHGFAIATTQYKDIISDKDVDLVMVTTRHNQHAQMVCECIESNKHVFVEKPLAINNEQLKNIIETLQKNPAHAGISVGFNRRFSPFSIKAKQLLGNNDTAINMIATMNAGFIPEDVWVHDMQSGGGRIIGEACHFIDLMTYFNGSKVSSIFMSALGKNPQENTDNAIITLQFENGSQGVINYFANGSKKYSKERVEIYSQNRTLVLDNFRKLEGFGFKGFTKMSGRQDKGHKNQFHQLVKFIQNGGETLIPIDELINTTAASIAAIQSLKENKNISIH